MSTDAGRAEEGRATVAIPTGVHVRIDGRHVVAKGPAGEVRRDFPVEAIGLTVHAHAVELLLKLPTNRKQTKSLLNTWERHVGNLMTGASQGFEAKLVQEEGTSLLYTRRVVKEIVIEGEPPSA